MESLFLKLVNLSLTAGLLVLAVLVLRLIFRKASKWTFCVLWGLVALRLVIPFSFESALSVIPSAEPIPAEITSSENPRIDSGIQIIDNTINPIISDSFSPAVGESVNPLKIWIEAFSWIWLAGLAAMLIYAIVSTVLLKRKLRMSTPFRKGIKQSEYAETPFVLGIIHPVIYLPYRIDDNDLAHVIAHEQAHIQRKDHWWKPLGFLLLSVYWFNPIIWVAYIFLCRDIEAACDEKVIGNMDTDSLRAYSEALLNCSINRRTIKACPIAFGEVGVKERVKNVMNYKKPAFWIILIAVLACIVVAVCFMTSPKGEYRIPWDQFCISAEGHEITLSAEDKKYVAKLLNHGTWADDARTPEEWNYQFFFAEQTVRYDSQTGIFSDDMNKKSMTASETERQKINRMLGHFDGTAEGCIHVPDPAKLSLSIVANDLYGDKPSITVEWKNLDKNNFEYEYDGYCVFVYKDGQYTTMPGNDIFYSVLPLKILLPGGKDQRKYDLSMYTLENGKKYRLYLFSFGPSEYWIDFTVDKMPAYVVGDGEKLDPAVNGYSDEEYIEKLKEKYPEYFGLPTMKGLEVYVWQMAHNSYSFGLLSGTNRSKTDEELWNLKGVTASEMKAILSTYDIGEEMIAVIPFQHIFSSYIADYWISEIGESESSIQSRRDAYIGNIRSMLFDD